MKKLSKYDNIWNMGILVNLNDDRSELQKRIAAELDQKTKGKNKRVIKSRKDYDLEPEDIDGVDDMEYVKDYAQSKTLNLDKTWWVLIGGGIVVIIVIIVLAVTG